MVSRFVPRPFLKWAGGKSQLLDELLARMPSHFNVYHEPFVGGGALFFALSRLGRIRRAYLSDINAELIDTYLSLRDDVEGVIHHLSQFPYSKEFYYYLRSLDPNTLPLPFKAARMIYLNKTGYNGLYRVNRQGQFNVPFGRYKSPSYSDRDNLLAVSIALQSADIVCASFEKVLERAEAGDWVYFDPPYVPLSKTANFTSYHSDGFSLDDQIKLRDTCLELARRGVFFMLSNSDTEVVRRLYDYPHFFIYEAQASRAINCMGNRRGKITELIVTNYPTDSYLQLSFTSLNTSSSSPAHP